MSTVLVVLLLAGVCAAVAFIWIPAAIGIVRGCWRWCHGERRPKARTSAAEAAYLVALEDEPVGGSS